LWLPILWTAAIAQAPLDEHQSTGASADEGTVPCIPADGAQASAAKSGPLESPAEGAGEVLEPCEEVSPGTTSGEQPALAGPPGESNPGDGSNPEEAADAEASADEVFKPVDEISEDYAVPLPSDI